MPLYVVLAGVGRRIVHQFEIELAALQIGPLDANTHGIAQGEDPSFAASIDLVAVLVELVEVVLHSRSETMPSMWVSSSSTYMPQSLMPEIWPSKNWPILSCMNSTICT